MAMKGLVSLITGGASGLGKATVERFVKNGAKAIICDLPKSEGHSIAQTIGETNVSFAACDVRNEEQVISAVQMAKDKFGKLDICVNCAGYGVAFRSVNFKTNATHQMADFQDVININLLGTFCVSKHAALLIGQNKEDEHGLRGVIINTSSIAAFEGQIGQVAYAASKGAINGMTLPLARDLGNRGIRVVTIAPGVFDTPLLYQLPDKVKTFLSDMNIAPRRLGQPDEYAQLAQTIVENRFINGEVIRLDAGIRMQA